MLYSINETNATVALQNVRSFGTEGREITEPGLAFVAASPDAVHPYLLFRGQDIKDLHVHEEQGDEDPPAVIPKKETAAPRAAAAVAPKPAAPKPAPPKPAAPPKKAWQTVPGPVATRSTPQDENKKTPQPQGGGGNSGGGYQQQGGRGAGGNRRQRNNNANNNSAAAGAVGTGASLLKRTERGAVNGGTAAQATPKNDFDFQSNLDDFAKEDAEEDEAGDSLNVNTGTYEKDDFFDSISCDALDKEHGIDKRLRGTQERSLNTETFGAVSLNSQRRRRGGRGGRGRGRGGGRGGGGRGRGRGGGGRGRGRSQRESSNGQGQRQSFASAAAASS